MGMGSSKKKKDNSGSIKTFIKPCKKDMDSAKNKKNDSAKGKRKEIIDYLKDKNLPFAKANMESLIKEENYIKAFDILAPILDKLNDKSKDIDSAKECPADLRTELDSVIYAASKIEIQEFVNLKDCITKKYGQDYVTKAENNEDNKINQDLVDNLSQNKTADNILIIRLKQLCKEENIQFEFQSEAIPSPNIGQSIALVTNPYSGQAQFPMDLQENNKNDNPFLNAVQNPFEGNDQPYYS
jgi:vacuolar protein sorting-associated protein IST1